MWNDRGLAIDRLKKVGAGHYVSTQPIPVWGRVEDVAARSGRHDDDRGPDLGSRPTTAIPVPEIPAQGVSTRPFVLEVTILQRERDPSVPAWLFTAGGDRGADASR